MPSDIRTKLAVPAEKLRRICAPVAPSTACDVSGVIGQESAMASLDLGLKLSSGDYAMSHYNIVVVGPPNTGRTAKTLRYLKLHAAAIECAPPDVLCVHDFSAPRRPVVIYVPNGQGQVIKKRLEMFGKYAAKVIPMKVAQLRGQHLKALKAVIDALWSAAGDKVKAFGFFIAEDETRRFLVPISLSDPEQPMSQEEFEALPDDIKDKLSGENNDKATAVLQQTQATARQLIAASETEKVKAERQLVKDIVDKQINILRGLVGESEFFANYLAELEKLVTKHAFAKKSEASGGPMIMLGQRPSSEDDTASVLVRVTQVNLLVDNHGAKQPPVIHVTVPQYSTLFGRINAHLYGPGEGVRVDHTMVDGGEMLRANGGYLVLDLEDLLRWGGALAFYKLLKVIRTRCLEIEGKSRFVDAESLIDFRVQEVPVNVRVIVTCDWHLARLLRHYEPEFDNLFRVVAEFDDQMDIADAPAAYAAFVEICRAESGLPEFTPEAVAKLVEYGSRRADDQNKASAEFGVIKDLITEAAHWAKQAEMQTVGPEHVRRAIEERFNRQALLIRNYQERFLDSGKLLFDHEGTKIGQISGLAVLAVSKEIVFGVPTRITARAFAGPEKVVLVQREAELSGPSSNTAIAVIRGYLSGQYGQKKPLGLAVQLCFEQCYGGIDGDSATLAEVIAMISAITGLPVDQRLAITGSMNQWGEAQPIGGANEKIEGHFGILKRRGVLKTGHGVVLPWSNLDELMLKEEVVDAQRQGLYQVYAVSHVDEALEIFLGRPAKEIHKLVAEKLTEIAGGSKTRAFLRKLFRRNKGGTEG